MITKRLAYQIALIELAKIAYEIHSRGARKVKFEIHKRSGKFVVYFDDSVYKDINFNYGFTLAKEVYSIFSGKKDPQEVEKGMNEDTQFSYEGQNNGQTRLNIPLLGSRAIEYRHQNKPGEIFEISLEWKNSTPYNQLVEKLEEIKEKANDDNYKVVFNPENKEDIYDERFNVEDINLKKLVIYYEDGGRYPINWASIETNKDVQDTLEHFFIQSMT